MKNEEVIQSLKINDKWIPIVETIDLADFMHPEFLILPAFDDNENSALYFIFDTKNIYEKYLEVLNSFIGPSYSTECRVINPETSNDLEVALFNASSERNTIVKIEILQVYQADVLDIIKKMVKLLQKSGSREKTYKIPLEGLIRNYDLALLNADYIMAEELLMKLKDNGELSYENIEFLKIKLYERKNNWGLIFSTGEQLLYYPRPSLITRHILKSCFYVKLKEEVSKENFDAVAAIYQAQFDNDRFRGLFHYRYNFKDPEILILFALKEYFSAKLIVGTLEELENDFPVDGEYHSFFERILEKIRSREKDFIDSSKIENAEELYKNGKTEDALKVLYMLTLSERVIELLLEYTLDLDIAEYYIITQEKLSECNDELRKKILQRRRNQKDWDTIFEVQMVNSWEEWFEKITLEPSNVKIYREIAENAQINWGIEKYLNSEAAINDIAILISLNKDNYIFKQSFPYFIDYFFLEKYNREFKPIYLSILDMIATSKDISDLPVFESILEVLLELVVEQKEYDLILSYIEDTWISIESEKAFPWLLDVVNMLETYPCYNTKKKEVMFNYMMGFAGQRNHRLKPDYLEIIGLLCADYNYPVSQLPWWKQPEILADENDEKINVVFLQNKRVAIYSLFMPVLTNVKLYLENRYPGVDVRINDDKEDTERLRYLARNADIFLFAWNAAKHQAYYCVKKYIDKEKLLMVSGKGSNSIIRSLNEYILKQTQK